MRPPFEIIEHPADVGFLAYGSTLEELFANAALAMMSLGYELDAIEERQRREISAEGRDTEELLFEWLSDILAISDAEKLVFRRFEIAELGAGRIRGAAWGEKFDRARHRAGTYIKAVTYHQLRVEKKDDGWTAQTYLDV